MTLRDAIAAVVIKVQGWPQLAADPIALPRAARALERKFGQSVTVNLEEEERFLARVVRHPPADLRPRELRRALAPAWRLLNRKGAVPPEWVQDLTTTALGMQRGAADRALVSTWLDVFPTCDGAELLARAAAKAAERHDWPYRAAGRRFALWSPVEGPRKLGRALLEADDLSTVLQEAAIGPGRLPSAFVQASVASICDEVAETKGQQAENECEALLDLLERFGPNGILSDTQPRVVRALLRPWRTVPPSKELKVRIQKRLVATVGDPRTSPTRWLGIEAALRALGHAGDADTLRLVLKRWLVTASFEIFFRVMGRTTEDPVQWRAREKFWRAYLEKGHVGEAWFILGSEAERQAKAYREELAEAGGFGRFDAGANPGHSALLMAIGNVVIGEWTHNGSCCFWQMNAVRRPELYKARYDGKYLRNSEAMRSAADRQARELQSSPLWEAHAHHSGWEHKFTQVIHRLTGIRP
ncbi:MAG: EH signature domain-containing protein [Sphingomonadaceae bacterium]